MRILQVVHGFAPECRGGTESYVLEASAALTALGHSVSVLSGSLEPRTPAQLASGEVDGIPVTRLHRSGLFLDNWEKSFDPIAGDLFAGMLERERPDVVHVHHWIRLTRNLVEIAASLGVSAVVTLHDAAASCPRVFRVRDETLCGRPLSAESCLRCVPRPAWMDDAECGEEIEAYRRDFHRELRLASALVVPSRAHQEFMARELGLPASAFRVVPHGRLERNRPGRLEARSRSGRIRLGHWGHLEPYKGYHLLLAALQSLSAAERKRFEVVCFGVAPDPGYRRRLDELSAGLAVTEAGPFTPADLTARPIDLAVIPSLASESYSFVLDEAFELGVPALVSDRGALAERLRGAGATFEPESAPALAARLRQVLADPGLLDRWSDAIPTLGSMEEHAARLARIYGGAVRHQKPPIAPDPEVVSARLASLARRLEIRTQALDQAAALAQGRTDELRRKEADIGEFGRSVEGHEKLLAEARSVIEARDSAIAALERSIAGHRGEIESRDAEVARREQVISAKDAVIAEFERSISEHRAEIGRRDAELRAFEQSARELRESVRRLQQEITDRAAGHAAAEETWQRSVSEYRESVRLHSEALSARQAELAIAAARAETLREALDAATARAVEGMRAARGLEAEVAGLQAEASVEREARANAERDSRLLDVARAEDQKLLASWRDRALRAESDLAAVEATLASTTALLSVAHEDIAGQRRRIEALEDDARRVDELARRGSSALAVPLRVDADRVGAAADLVGAVVAQQDGIDHLRAWVQGRNGAGNVGEVLRRLDALPRRLRVLVVIHDFLPYHAAGSEVYTYQLAKALSVRQDVELVFCENRPERPQYETRRDFYDGLPFTEIVHHSAFPDFRDTYRDPAMEARFDAILDRFRPDVVHVQHTKFFGVGILARAARRGIPVVYTLHEYMLLCARDGQMLRPDGGRCDLPEVDVCAACVASTLVESGTWSAGVRRAGRGLSLVLPGALKGVGSRIARRAAVRHGTPVDASRRPALIEARQTAVREALGHVDLFLAPSEFLRRTFVDAGFVSPERIVVSRYGQDLTRFHDPPRRTAGSLRVGYLGTVAAYKGVHILVEALNRLAGHDVEGRIHGVTEFFPAFVRDLEAAISNPRVRLMGRYRNADVGRILSEMDVLVVPSLWWENSPITIHEAFLAGVPVVASDQGGMAELVQDGVNGFLFKIGDAADLARVLLRFVADPGLVERLRPRREIIRDIREDALWTEGQYRRLLAERAASG